MKCGTRLAPNSAYEFELTETNGIHPTEPSICPSDTVVANRASITRTFVQFVRSIRQSTSCYSQDYAIALYCMFALLSAYHKVRRWFCSRYQFVFRTAIRAHTRAYEIIRVRIPPVHVLRNLNICTICIAVTAIEKKSIIFFIILCAVLKCPYFKLIGYYITICTMYIISNSYCFLCAEFVRQKTF